MGEGFIVRKGGVTSEATAAPTITIISETATDVTFTLTNNDDNTAVIVYEIDTTQDFVELAAAATSSNITVALAAGTYTLTAFATVVGEVASQSTSAVEIVAIPAYEELFSTTVATATTQIDITGLSIGKADTLRLVYTMTANGLSGNFGIFPNDLIVVTNNYFWQRLLGNGTNLIALRGNANIASELFSASDVQGFADIKVSNNDRFVYQSQVTEQLSTSTLRQQNHNVVGVQTVSSITKLSIIASSTNAIAVGSKIALYKVTEAA